MALQITLTGQNENVDVLKAVVTDELAPWTGRWPDEVNGPWEVTLRWRWSEDRAECVGFELTLLEGKDVEPISATLMRSVPVMRLVSRARYERWERAGGAVLDALDDGQELDIGPSYEADLRRAAGSWQERRPGRPATLDLEHYRAVAEVYSAAHAAGTPPLVAVQEGWRVARPTASRWVAAARDRGLLPSTERGKAKGNADMLNQEEPS